jgi:DNA-binding NarL/FixJ family response regulator
MASIQVVLYGSYKIVLDGIESLLSGSNEIEVVEKFTDYQVLFQALNNELDFNILLLCLNALEKQDLEIILSIRSDHPSVKILVLSLQDNEDAILKIIKSGAKGFLAAETNQSELFEAIYSIYNGYDYHSKSITSILLKNYIELINTGKSKTHKQEISLLSKREIEIIKLWGDSFTNKEIADRLFISVRTVESHKNHIMQKLNLKTSVDLVKFALKNNLIKI